MLLPSHFPTLFHDFIAILNKSEEYEGNLARVLKRRLLDYMKAEKISRHRPFEFEGAVLSNSQSHAERMKEYKKTSSTIRTAALEALKEYKGADDSE